MRRSIATVTLSGTLEDKLEAISAAGFDAVQIYESDLTYYDGAPREIREIAEELGLAIEGFQPLRDFEGLPDDQYRKAMAQAERKFDKMAELGAPLLLVTANTLASARPEPERAASHLRALAERAAQRNIKLAYGPLAWAAHVKRLRQAWEIVQLAAHPHLDVVVSTFQLLATGDDRECLSGIPTNRIGALQISDAPNVSLDPVSKNRFYSCFPGQGDLDLARLVREVLRRGYTGSLTLEVFNDAVRGAPTRVMADDSMRSLLFLEEEVRKSLDGKGADHVDVSLFDPPPPAHIFGLEFIEFAASGNDADNLATWVESFGFRKMGRHRSKNVHLYRYGDVNLALNSEPNSFAQSYYLLHGPSVCAVGMRADDNQRALGRALSFRAVRFEGRVGPNELSIPAIRAPVGSLIYFVNEKDAEHLYEIEFTLDQKDVPPGLKAVDHLALSLPPGQMDGWILFYRAVLGFEADATWMLSDPNGLVTSRAISSQGHSVRIPLNVSLSARTATARSVDYQAGAGVHHVAFSCENIIETVAQLRKSGAKLLTIPASYYEDLASRFDLDEAMIKKLQDSHLLYDRIGEGEFLHAYSEPFQDRFFFEFVQRLGGYDQYGAANAPFRMAAFARLQRARDRQLFG